MQIGSALVTFGIAVLVFSADYQRAWAQSSDQISFDLFGDFRLRTQIDRDRTSGADRTRFRLRFRVGLRIDLLENVNLVARMATFSDDTNPNSGHVTLGEGFRNIDFYFDRAYLQWDVPIERDLRILFGKFPNPVGSAFPFSEILWDKDIAPEGIAAVFRPVEAVTLVAGEYLILQRAPGRTINITAAQVRIGGELTESLTGTAAAGTYQHRRTDAGAASFLAIGDKGNVLALDPTTGDVVGFASDFEIYHLWTTARYTGAGIPIGVSAQYITNGGAAPGFDNDGWAAGFELGRLRGVGTWRAQYQYQEIGQEAVFSALAHDELPDATNYRGHYGTFGVRLHPRITATAKAFLSARQLPRVNTLQKRFRLDVDVVF